ncbi:MAG: DUF934 domain-containing protein [Oceanobacter sp.]
MATLLNSTQVIEQDQWQALAEDQQAGEFSIVSLTYWQEHQAELTSLAASGKLGLQLESGETADLVGEHAGQFALICIDFPKFIDGRGYSAARLLRERYGYQGELRAIGDVLIDQLFFMKRVGFNSFALRADQDVEDAITAFQTFTNPYQGDVHDSRPLFRRHAG